MVPTALRPLGLLGVLRALAISGFLWFLSLFGFLVSLEFLGFPWPKGPSGACGLKGSLGL